MSALEFSELPETNKIVELIEGEVVVSPSATSQHQGVVGNIFEALSRWAKATGAGKVFVAALDVHLAWDTVLQPDVLFIATARLGILRGKVHGAPDLVVEVLSPGTAAYDRGDKMRLYERHGVPEYWIADADARRVERYEAGPKGFRLAHMFAEGEVLVSALLPGFEVQVKDIFAV
jgi:Uma2 family endonuclease